MKKSQRFEIRLSPDERSDIEKAAEIQHETITKFLRNSILRIARRILKGTQK